MCDIKNNMDFVDIFEQKLAKYCGCKYAVATDCCTNAMIMSLHTKVKTGELPTYKIKMPAYTYMSVPMTFRMFGCQVFLDESYKWNEFYQLRDNQTGKSLNIIDSAVYFKENMCKDTRLDMSTDLVCVSFQQKKRLNLGRGGAVLTDNEQYYRLLKRLVYDGRNPKISDRFEVENNPEDIICGFHMYMEPEKAARGIAILNQPSMMKPYEIQTWENYPNLVKLKQLW